MPENSAAVTPRDNTFLIGHEEAEKLFLQCWKNNSLHNSWLISGIEGIGKATLAYRLARFILHADDSRRDAYDKLDVAPDTQTFRLISNNAHPDFKIIERDYTDTDRKKIIKAIKDGGQMSREELDGLKKSAFIRIDDVRTINEFLSRRSSQDGWRVVLIDSIDDMNNASANAVLKILEEPPHKALMLLVSHNPGRLLPTIRSRCAKLELKPLADVQVASLLRRYRPEMTEAQIKKIVTIASGSIGKALNYADNDAVSLYDSLCALAGAGSSARISDVLDFCGSAVADEDSYELSKELILKFLSEKIKNTSRVAETADIWEYAVRTFSETEGLNLDKKQALINIVNHICRG